MTWKSKDLLTLEELSASEIQTILDTASSFKEVSTRSVKKVPALRGRTVVLFFQEPSTRTRVSFELAAKRLSADILNVQTASSSLVKGETLIDTLKTLESMTIDALVVRHKCSGVPLMLANMTSYVLARHWRPTPIYDALLEQDGVHLASRNATEEVESLRLEQFVKSDAALRTFRLGARAEDVVAGRRDDPNQVVSPVVDDAGKIVGIITPDEIAILAAEPELLALVNAADLMRPTVAVDLDDDLGFALQKMISNGLSQLPITDRDGRCVGAVTESDIAKAYLRVKRPKSVPDPGEAGS